uniref:Uncharacterized protein n=1 Tax=Aegilops tauschii subsp. strangulata TaxID=200361 RepID=A0A453GIK1_AEGTS
MGSFKGHVLPGTLFLAVGAWHVWAAVARFAMDPAGFRLRVWNPVGAGGGALRHLELYVIAGGAFLDMCVEVLYSTHLHIFAPGGGVNPAHLNDLEHGGMLLMFFLVGALALLSENTRSAHHPPIHPLSRSHDPRFIHPVFLGILFISFSFHSTV